MKKILIILSITSFFISCNNSKIDNETKATNLLSQIDTASKYPITDLQNKENWVFNKTMSDEFNEKSLDKNKWFNLGENDDYHNKWKGRAPAQYNPNNVEVKNGNLNIYGKWTPNFKFETKKFNNGYYYGKPIPMTTGAIISQNFIQYGYMEVRAKIAKGPMTSAFWTTGKDGEMDIFEYYGKANLKEKGKKTAFSNVNLKTSFHDWRKDSKNFGKTCWFNSYITDKPMSEQYHIYGYEWDPNYVKIYLDGKLVGKTNKKEISDNWTAYNPHRIWFDSEQFEWIHNPRSLTKADFINPLNFKVDYLRVWQHGKIGK